MKYAGKSWVKVGRGAQSPKQLAELGKLIEEFPTEAVTATLEETGKPVIVVIAGEAKARKITAAGTVTEIAKPKDENVVELQPA